MIYAPCAGTMYHLHYKAQSRASACYKGAWGWPSHVLPTAQRAGTGHTLHVAPCQTGLACLLWHSLFQTTIGATVLARGWPGRPGRCHSHRGQSQVTTPGVVLTATVSIVMVQWTSAMEPTIFVTQSQKVDAESFCTGPSFCYATANTMLFFKNIWKRKRKWFSLDSRLWQTSKETN